MTGLFIELDPAAARLSRLRRRIFAWVETMQEAKHVCRKSWAMMITLTYRQVGDWKPQHIREFMLWVKKRLGERLLGYAWVAELQERGAIHYHVLVNLTNGKRLPMPDKVGAWPHGSSRIEKARTLYYIAKYAQKGQGPNDNSYPRGARIFATYVSPDARCVGAHTNYKSSVYPKWLRDIVDIGTYGKVARRQPRGGWRIGKYLFASPYQIVSVK
jgi:hypothetical protein